MGIAQIVAVGILALSGIVSLYKAGKYANGGKDVHEGNAAAVGSVINFIIMIVLAIALYLNI